MNSQQIIQTVTVYAIPVLFAISLHEAAHGYVARYFGDSTAADLGRVSINPFRHIDPFGTVLMPLGLALMSLPAIGFAKPVPVQYSRLRNPKKQMAYVALAGPAANFLMGLAWSLFLIVLLNSRVPGSIFIDIAKAGVWVNAAMCVFNLIPIPPLDGGRVLTGLLPMPLAIKFAQIERYSLFVFVGLIALMQFRLLDGVLFTGMRFVVGLFDRILSPITFFLN
jgi:Zn-dependent protease